MSEEINHFNYSTHEKEKQNERRIIKVRSGGLFYMQAKY